MARKKHEPKVGFDAMPPELANAVGPDVSDERKRELHAWVERNGLTMVDFFSWKRDQLDAKRPPSRRRKLRIVD